MKNDLEIVDVFRSVVEKTSENLEIEYPDGEGGSEIIMCPVLQYIFGNSQYVKDMLDIYSKVPETSGSKYPLIALFCPINEERNDPDYYSKAKVSILIACSSRKEWTNEERLVTSFRNILRPVYNSFIEVLKDDSRFDWGYNEIIKHEYSENYSYGRYGAYTENREALSEPIDAINIRSLEIKINNPNCVRK